MKDGELHVGMQFQTKDYAIIMFKHLLLAELNSIQSD